MWERYSYYNMFALLALFLVAPIADGGMAWQNGDALRFFGLYLLTISTAPLLGGYVADRWLRADRALMVGGATLFAGHSLLAMPNIIRWYADHHGAMAMTPYMTQHHLALAQLPAPALPADLAGPYALSSLAFYGAIIFVAIGNGMFKPILTVIVGRLPYATPAERERGFTTFFVFNNIGGLMSVLIGGVLAQSLGWGWAFGAAAIGMAIAVVATLAFRRRYILPFVETAPVPVVAEASTPGLWRSQLPVVLLMLMMTVSAMCSYQSYGFVSLFNDGLVDRSFAGVTIPASWFTAIDPISVLVFSPILIALWKRQGLGHDWTPTVKFAVGFVMMATAFAAMIAAAKQAEVMGKASPVWIIYTIFVMAFTQLLTTPAAMSAITRLAPAHRQTFAVGLLTTALGIGGWFSGKIGGLAMDAGMVPVLLGLTAFSVAGAIVLALVRRRMARMTI